MIHETRNVPVAMQSPIASKIAEVQRNHAASPEAAPTSSRQEAMREQAQKFEAVFIAQMLNYSGLTKAIGQGGGFGGETFSSMLSEQYAQAIVKDGGFGLAPKIYAQLASQDNQGATDANY